MSFSAGTGQPNSANAARDDNPLFLGNIKPTINARFCSGGSPMPIHDWSRVSAGTFHHFHTSWIVEIGGALNAGLLPAGYYAMAEQMAGDVWPDVLTLQSSASNGENVPEDGRGAIAVAEAPPKVRFTATAEIDLYVLKQHTLVIRHSSDDRIIALLEILSPGNKSSRHAFRAFLDKATAALAHGYHLLMVDLHPPTLRDPQGIHGALWEEIVEDTYVAPQDKPLTLAAYSAGLLKKAYVEPVAVGDLLPNMPLFLHPNSYVSVPLEATYQAAWRGVPERWRTVLEGS
jgi:hypothetical protein